MISPLHTLNVNSDDIKRLDKFVGQDLGLSRREVLLLLEHELIFLNGRKLTVKAKGTVLKEGDKLEIGDYHHLISQVIKANHELPLNILAQGSGYIVVDKAAGLPVMPQKPEETDTVLNTVLAHYPHVQGVGEGGFKSGIVHRLDTDTSGTLIIATEEAMWQRLREAFKAHQTSKVYRALVKGNLQGSAYEEMHLAITQHKPAKVRVLASTSSYKGIRKCDLKWKSLENFNDASLIEVELGTGFLHQIRVMFAHMGHPVIGDKLYGQEANSYGAERQMLHAASLEVLGIEAHSPVPDDFQTVLARLRNTA